MNLFCPEHSMANKNAVIDHIQIRSDRMHGYSDWQQ